MSKKTRRYRTPNMPTSAYGSPASTTPAVASVPAARAPVAKIINTNWQDEYHEVLGDLKKTGIIAVVLLAAMAGLSFFLR